MTAATDPRRDPSNVVEEIQDGLSGLKYKLHQWLDKKEGVIRFYVEPAFELAVNDGRLVIFQK